MKRTRAKRWSDGRRWARLGVHTLDFRRDLEVALGAQEKTIAWTLDASDGPHILVQLRMRRSRPESKVAGAAFRVESKGDGQSLEDRRLSRSVLTDEERDRSFEGESLEPDHCWKGKRIATEVRNSIATEDELA
jgi:hypothetical protein